MDESRREREERSEATDAESDAAEDADAILGVFLKVFAGLLGCWALKKSRSRCRGVLIVKVNNRGETRSLALRAGRCGRFCPIAKASQLEVCDHLE